MKFPSYQVLALCFICLLKSIFLYTNKLKVDGGGTFFRYWSHVVNCSSCKVAYKGLNALEVVLQVISIASLGIFAATKQSLVSGAARVLMVAMAILCFASSRWLSHFIYKNFHFHDYNHALR